MDNRETLKALVELGHRMRAIDKAAADAWNHPTDAEHSRLCLEADKLFEEFGHAAEAALPSLEALLAEPATVPVSELEALINEHGHIEDGKALRSLINRSHK